MLPPPVADPDWAKVIAARWRKRAGRGYLQPVPHPHAVALSALVAIDAQKDAIDAQHAAVRRRTAGQQRAAHRIARDRQVVAGEGDAREVRAEGPAPDRGRQGRPGRPSRHRRADRGAPRALRRVLRRPDVRRGRRRLQGAQGRARRIDRRRGVERAHLRDVEPPAPAARVHEREPRDEARRRRGASGRVRRGEDLAVGALRVVDLVLPVRAGRLPCRRASAGSSISA